MAPPAARLGRMLLERGLLTPEQLAASLREYDNTLRSGAPADLCDIIVSRGYLTREQISPALEPVREPEVERGSPLQVGTMPSEVLDARGDPRRVIQKYTLVEELGRGGMAVVYKAWDATLQQYVALKLIRSQDIGSSGPADEQAVAEFLREARTAVKLTHPHIVRVYELGRHEDRHFLSMEYLEGHSLAHLLRKGKKRGREPAFYSSPKKYLAILKQVAEALDYAHSQNPPIVHRDVKPQNILVDRSGRAVLVDFGLAKELKADAALTLSGTIKGTPAYMAPEQVLGKAEAVDGRTDVYALGAILFECLTGRPPFTGDTERDIMTRIARDEPIPPSQALAAEGSAVQLMPDLERICMKALQKDPSRRYPTAQDFAADLQSFMEGKAVAAQAATRWVPLWRWVVSRKAILIASAAALLLGLAAVASLGNRTPAPTAAPLDPEALRQATQSLRTSLDEMQYGKAALACREFIARLGEGTERDAWRQKLEEIGYEEALFEGLVERVQKGPRDYERIALEDGALQRVRLLDATPDALALRVSGGRVEVPWKKLAPAQYVDLVRDYWPDRTGHARLGLLLWCVRKGQAREAAEVAKPLFGTADDGRAREYLGRLPGQKP